MAVTDADHYTGQITTRVDGIGHVLADSKLEIPDYQRSFSWSDDEVRELWDDVLKAIRDNVPDYFLGSMVTTAGAERDQVIDGQQRLATVSILFSAMRDILKSRSDERAEDIERDYLGRKNIRTREWQPKLKLNSDDNAIFQLIIEGRFSEAKRQATRDSHKALVKAYEILHEKMEQAIADLPATSWQAPLVELHEYLLSSANIIRVSVPSESRAFVIFETLNDRGLNLSTADLLKGHLFGTAGGRVEECKYSWAQAMAPFSGDDRSSTDQFLRHYWSSREGVSRVKALFSQMRDSVSTSEEAVALASELGKAAPLWASMFERDAAFWENYPDSAKESLEVLGALKVEQCRPLLLAVMQKFPKQEIEKVLELLISWSIRWFVVGGSGAGVTERLYAEAAKAVSLGEVTTASEVSARFIERVPSDQEFEKQFAVMSVRRGWLARYYLHQIEKYRRGEDQPEFISNSDVTEVNLEHVLARNAARSDWPAFSDDEFTDMKLLIGNQCLLRQRVNEGLGNGPFASKKGPLSQSGYLLTQEIAQCADWTPDKIWARQERLAVDAVKIWVRGV
ncbi:DUF262 domain-containing protein [Propionibacterium freudenreichii]|uniref:DUF262 domain-containing protein n=2 Tax=Propionibacterium freudenreichii TaxID=1744 RepID=UPI000BC356A6|nr:DUF262 domain-containing protein [Propionibacterium freudenreichii]MDK9592263.1 DUF262 domain-containing protein [Propionibacterium freudenreichii]WFF35083.1 DUF262 domain-containing protein [Propionibacterium freudenreichii]WFF37311.1 DUF262 domain-containing protein [Propionibacterium freudenreichii]SBN49523.1 RloF [Propionibacterium freudenreichii]